MSKGYYLIKAGSYSLVFKGSGSTMVFTHGAPIIAYTKISAEKLLKKARKINQKAKLVYYK